MRYTVQEKLVQECNVYRSRLNVAMTMGDAHRLRRDALILNRSHELSCGTGRCAPKGYTVSTETDEETGSVFKRYEGPGRSDLVPTKDLVTPALKRIEMICARYGLHYYEQTDPRGMPLYIGTEPLDSINYTSGSAVAVSVG